MSPSPSTIDPDRLTGLIGRHLVGILDASDSQELESVLACSAAAREAFRLQCSLDSALRQQAGEVVESESSKIAAAPTVSGPRETWFNRSALATAVGLVVGVVTTSLVWANALPQVVVIAQRLSIYDGSFEGLGGRLPSGLPSKYGKWSGDESEVAEMPAMKAKDGKRALRFVRAEREPSLPNYGAGSCDVYQLVDLRSLKAEAASLESTLELSVQFLDVRASIGEPVMFIGRLHIFAGAPDDLPTEWPMTQKEALASGSGSFESTGGSPQAWYQVTTKVLLPPQSDFAVVHILAHKPKNPSGTEATFGAQFVDDVRLTLKSQPALPVRAATR